MKRRGIFITLEGIDGTGKSTQFRLLVEALRRRKLPVCATREPGGTGTGEQVRSILLASKTGKLAPLAELALIYAARAQHLGEVVRPALARGEIVVSDRYNDSSYAYQGYGRRLGVEVVRAFESGARKLEPRRVAAFGSPLHRRPAGIRESQQPRDLVESLTGCIVQGRAEPSVRQVVGHEVQFGMPAGDQQSHQWE